MLRHVLLVILAMVVARVVSRAVGEVIAGYARPSHSPQSGRPPARGVQMVRDPVCGTFVIPDRAFPLVDGSHEAFFCSTSCRDQYRAHTA